MNKLFFSCSTMLCILIPAILFSQPKQVSKSEMEQIYEEIKTPYKYGLVVVPESKNEMVDSPSIFNYKDSWYMVYIVYDGRGYETWIAKSEDLLQWKTLGKILSFTLNTWDANQKAGYIALQNYEWGGKYNVAKYKGKFWMSYLGGASQGYEEGVLGIGIANTQKLIKAKEWNRLKNPVLLPTDSNVRWYDNEKLYKSTIIEDKDRTLGSRFVMFYNAVNKPEINNGTGKAERIAMAVSDDMNKWERFGEQPVIDHHSGISGDAYISKIGNLWVMFYFGAFWKPGAFDRFACSYDLINWTDWEGKDLISPSEPYDDLYAHKPFVIKHNGIVYHYYCAVNNKNQRSIAVATSVDLGKSKLKFPED
jgi:predicted GH43/DUF377 family glycosyl hydrolase